MHTSTGSEVSQRVSHSINHRLKAEGGGSEVARTVLLSPKRPASRLRRADHAAERLAAEQVEVEVRHFLMAVAAGVGEAAVAVVLAAEVLRELSGHPEEAGALRFTCLLREGSEGNGWAPGEIGKGAVGKERGRR